MLCIFCHKKSEGVGPDDFAAPFNEEGEKGVTPLPGPGHLGSGLGTMGVFRPLFICVELCFSK